MFQLTTNRRTFSVFLFNYVCMKPHEAYKPHEAHKPHGTDGAYVVSRRVSYVVLAYTGKGKGKLMIVTCDCCDSWW